MHQLVFFFYKVQAIHCCYHPQGIAISQTRKHQLMGLCVSMFFFLLLCQYLAAFLNDVTLSNKYIACQLLAQNHHQQWGSVAIVTRLEHYESSRDFLTCSSVEFLEPGADYCPARCLSSLVCPWQQIQHWMLLPQLLQWSCVWFTFGITQAGILHDLQQ